MLLSANITDSISSESQWKDSWSGVSIGLNWAIEKMRWIFQSLRASVCQKDVLSFPRSTISSHIAIQAFLYLLQKIW